MADTIAIDRNLPDGAVISRRSADESLDAAAQRLRSDPATRHARTLIVEEEPLVDEGGAGPVEASIPSKIDSVITPGALARLREHVDCLGRFLDESELILKKAGSDPSRGIDAQLLREVGDWTRAVHDEIDQELAHAERGFVRGSLTASLRLAQARSIQSGGQRKLRMPASALNYLVWERPGELAELMILATELVFARAGGQGELSVAFERIPLDRRVRVRFSAEAEPRAVADTDRIDRFRTLVRSLGGAIPKPPSDGIELTVVLPLAD